MWATTLVLLAVVACSFGGAAAGASAPAAAGNTTGVTKDSIKVAILTLGAGLEDQVNKQFGAAEEQFKPFIDAANKGKGINGRKLVPTFVGFDGTNNDSMRAACIKATEDVGAFATLNTLFFAPSATSCITQEHGTPLLMWNVSAPQEVFKQSGRNLFTVDASAERQLTTFVTELHKRGLLKGKKIGIVEADVGVNKVSTDAALIPTLDKLGYSVEVRSVLGNLAVAGSQVPVEVQAMKEKGIDTVLLVAPIIQGAMFVGEADKQGFAPKYYLSDFATGATDTYVQGMPSSFKGAMGFTALRTGESTAGVKEASVDASCRKQYETATGTKLERGTDPYRATMGACSLIQLVVAAAKKAGPNLTRERFVAALGSLGKVDLPFYGGGSFTARKHDAADLVRALKWDASCKCWTASEQFGSSGG